MDMNTVYGAFAAALINDLLHLDGFIQHRFKRTNSGSCGVVWWVARIVNPEAEVKGATSEPPSTKH